MFLTQVYGTILGASLSLGICLIPIDGTQALWLIMVSIVYSSS